MKTSTIRILALVTLLFASGCSSNNQDTPKLESQLIMDWKNSCSANSLSKACADYVYNLDVYFETFGYSSGSTHMLMADFYSRDAFGIRNSEIVGELYCFQSTNECVAPLEFFNPDTKPFQTGVTAELISYKLGTFASTDRQELDMNPKMFNLGTFYFRANDFSEWNMLRIKDTGLEKTRAEIKLCRQPDITEDGELIVIYTNCLRLKGYEYNNEEFTKKVS